jgi:hypothetical protein
LLMEPVLLCPTAQCSLGRRFQVQSLNEDWMLQPFLNLPVHPFHIK